MVTFWIEQEGIFFEVLDIGMFEDRRQRAEDALWGLLHSLGSLVNADAPCMGAQ